MYLKTHVSQWWMRSNPCQSVVDEMKILASNDDRNKVMAVLSNRGSSSNYDNYDGRKV